MKIKIRYLAAIAAGLLMVSNIAASKETLALVGAGANSCGKFIAETEDSELMRNLYFFWAQGFLSGLNFKYMKSARFAADLSDQEALILWIKNYCEDNPLDHYAAATVHLYRELRRRQGLDPDTIFILNDS